MSASNRRGNSRIARNVPANPHFICDLNQNATQIVGAIIIRPLQSVAEYCTFMFGTQIKFRFTEMFPGGRGNPPLQFSIHFCFVHRYNARFQKRIQTRDARSYKYFKTLIVPLTIIHHKTKDASL